MKHFYLFCAALLTFSAASASVTEDLFELYRKGNCILEVHFSPSGEPSDTIKNEWSSDGRILSQEHIYFEDSARYVDLDYFRYNENKQLTNIVDWELDPEVGPDFHYFDSTVYSYNAEGQKILMQVFEYDSCQWIAANREEFKYNEKGQLTEDTYYYVWDGELEFSDKVLCEYNEKGQKVKASQYRIGRNDKEYCCRIESLTYNEAGLPIEVKTQGLFENGEEAWKGKVVVDLDEQGQFAGMTYYTDQEGEWLSNCGLTVTYNADGNFSKIMNYERNDEGVYELCDTEVWYYEASTQLKNLSCQQILELIDLTGARQTKRSGFQILRSANGTQKVYTK